MKNTIISRVMQNPTPRPIDWAQEFGLSDSDPEADDLAAALPPPRYDLHQGPNDSPDSSPAPSPRPQTSTTSAVLMDQVYALDALSAKTKAAIKTLPSESPKKRVLTDRLTQLHAHRESTLAAATRAAEVAASNPAVEPHSARPSTRPTPRRHNTSALASIPANERLAKEMAAASAVMATMEARAHQEAQAKAAAVERQARDQAAAAVGTAKAKTRLSATAKAMAEKNASKAAVNSEIMVKRAAAQEQLQASTAAAAAVAKQVSVATAAKRQSRALEKALEGEQILAAGGNPYTVWRARAEADARATAVANMESAKAARELSIAQRLLKEEEDAAKNAARELAEKKAHQAAREKVLRAARVSSETAYVARMSELKAKKIHRTPAFPNPPPRSAGGSSSAGLNPPSSNNSSRPLHSPMTSRSAPPSPTSSSNTSSPRLPAIASAAPRVAPPTRAGGTKNTLRLNRTAPPESLSKGSRDAPFIPTIKTGPKHSAEARVVDGGLLISDFIPDTPVQVVLTLTNVTAVPNSFSPLPLPDSLGTLVSVSFSPPGKLSSGVGVPVTVTFSPGPTQDSVQGYIPFLARTGPFSIPFAATSRETIIRPQPAALTFPPLPLGELARKSITIHNDGAAPTILRVTLTTSDSSLYLTAGSSIVIEPLPGHSSVSLPVEFAPSSCNPVSGKLSLATADPSILPSDLSLQAATQALKLKEDVPWQELSDSMAISINATGEEPPVFVKDETLDMGIVVVNSLYRDTITIVNRGRTAHKISLAPPPGLGGSETLSFVPKVAFVQAGEAFRITVRFKPGATMERGPLTLPIRVNVPDQADPVFFVVKAVITDTQLTLDPPSIDFGNVFTSESVHRSFTVTNNSALPAHWGFLSLPPEFDINPPFGVLDPSGSIQLEAIFNPVAAVPSKADLGLWVVASPAAPTAKLSVRGTGSPPPLTLSPAALSLPAVALGESVASGITVANKSSVTRKFALRVPRGVGLDVQPRVAVLPPGSSTRLEVSYSPLADPSDPLLKRWLATIAPPPALPSPKPQPIMEVPAPVPTPAHPTPTSRRASRRASRRPTATEETPVTPATPNHQQAESTIQEEAEGAVSAEGPGAGEDQGSAGDGVEEEAGSSFNLREGRGYVEESVMDVTDGEVWSQSGTWTVAMVVEGLESVVHFSVDTVAVRPSVLIPSGKVQFDRVPLGSRVTQTVSLAHTGDFGAAKDVPLSLVAEPLDPTGPFSIVNALRTLQPDGRHGLLIAFQPSSEDDYLEEVHLKAVSDDGRVFGRLVIPLQGKGVLPKLTLRRPTPGQDLPDVLQLPDIVAGESSKLSLIVENASPFPVPYRVAVKPASNAAGRCGDSNTSDGLVVFDAAPAEGTVEPGASAPLTVTFHGDHASENYRGQLVLSMGGEAGLHGPTIPVKGRAWAYGLNARVSMWPGAADGSSPPSSNSSSSSSQDKAIALEFVWPGRTEAVLDILNLKASNGTSGSHGEYSIDQLTQEALSAGFNISNPLKGQVEAGKGIRNVTISFNPTPTTNGSGANVAKELEPSDSSPSPGGGAGDPLSFGGGMVVGGLGQWREATTLLRLKGGSPSPDGSDGQIVKLHLRGLVAGRLDEARPASAVPSPSPQARGTPTRAPRRPRRSRV